MDDFLTLEEFELQLNRLGKNKIPCLFVCNFDKTEFFLTTNLNHKDILYKFDTKQNYKSIQSKPLEIIQKSYTLQSKYKKQFNKVQHEIVSGNTYLLNLTNQTQIDINGTLEDIFNSTKAKFKMLFFDDFTFFSPERFIEIVDNHIYTYPMKGTLDASVPNAKEQLLSNQKELAEHIMVVDLLRNDLSMVSDDVRVKKFRYVEEIHTSKTKLLATSSKISAKLNSNWTDNLGSMLLRLLPAGSITGTPKSSTTQIIHDIEDYDRGFFTGVCGIFDGDSLDSAVMIRFIDKQNDKLYYKSGGGITYDSDMYAEYTEMCQKVYLPIK